MFNSLNINALHCFATISYFNSDKTKDSTHHLDKCTGYRISKTDKRELKFHTRARGNSQGCLSVDVSFIPGLDTVCAVLQ